MTTGKALLAVLAGVAAGTALGLLLAPKGSESKKKIIRIGGELGQALNEKIDERFDELLKSIAGKVKHARPVNGTQEKVELEV
jgi:gas vesicle protein